jgi:hypothetical protein
VEVGSLLIILVVLCAIVVLLYGPLRSRSAAPRDESADRVAELEARKEAKYREIRDAQMDMRTGKLSEQDFRILERQLRAEAIEILRALDEEPGHAVSDHRLG